jgi:hypothetical protein
MQEVENNEMLTNIVAGGSTTTVKTGLRLDGDCLSWANGFAQLARDTPLLACE